MINLGLGGGFNERGRVEYRSHDSDDDEYDKYGRRKKNVRKNSDDSKDRRNSDASKDRPFEKPVEPKHDVEEVDEEEEEEEDDDDEEDLVKNNIFFGNTPLKVVLILSFSVQKC